MSDENQFKILLAPDVVESLEAQRVELGFLSANALAVVYVRALAKLPPRRVFAALATLDQYQEIPKRTRKPLA